MSESDYQMQWPEEGVLPFGPMADAVVKAIRFAYRLERQNEGQDIPWGGPNIGEVERQDDCPEPHVQLAATYLAWSENNQDLTPLDQLVHLAIRLGIEQGRRRAIG